MEIDTNPNANTQTQIPSPPYQYLSGQPDFLDLSDLDSLISSREANRQAGYDLSSKIKSALLRARASLERIDQDRHLLDEQLETLILQALALDQDQDTGADVDAETDAVSPKGTKPRIANLSFSFGDYVRYKAYIHFLQTGTLIPQSNLKHAFTDEEYLSGVMTLNHDLARYAVGRATERDVASVVMARDLASKVLDHLMTYDFRNGNLRRKYDGVKYAVKTCETVLYELSVTGCDVSAFTNASASAIASASAVDSAELEDQVAKRAKIENDKIPQEELQRLCERMTHRDELREALIKKSRDGQKAAKQAIYALHRQDFKAAERLIEACEKCVIEDLNPIVNEEPQLRYGSFANVLEEYAEAKMFYAWLAGDGSSIDVAKPNGQVLLPSDFTKIPLEPEEYLGGLADLTGEVGRFAVTRGTQRDTPGVKLSLETDTSILYALDSLSKLPGGGLNKKIDPLRRSVEKLEKMLYELSLVKATGRNVVAGIDDMEVSQA
jgi:predicted translin family RNA/ssDNA-binding protein